MNDINKKYKMLCEECNEKYSAYLHADYKALSNKYDVSLQKESERTCKEWDDVEKMRREFVELN